MLRTPKFLEHSALKNRSLLIILLTSIVLWVDYATGKEIRFPILYFLPVAVAAWTGRRAMSYGLSVLLPLTRVAFHIPWGETESVPVAGINAVIDMITFSLCAYLVARKASQTEQLEKTISTRDKELQSLRAFAKSTSMTLQGRAGGPGLAEGVAAIYVSPETQAALDRRPISKGDVAAEIVRFESALQTSWQEVARIREQSVGQLSNAELGILDVQMAMIMDPSFAQKCKRRVQENLVDVEQAVTEEIWELEKMLQGMQQEFMRERSADVRDMGRRILRNLRMPGETTHDQIASLAPGTILVAVELTPSDVLQLDRAKVAALVMERGGPASHVAILARARHLPAVCNIGEATSLLASGDHLLVDGEAGTVTVAPTSTQVASFTARRNQYVAHMPVAVHGPAESSATRDGVGIRLLGTICRPDEARLVREFRLEGVGLFRSEFLFLDADRPPDHATQYAAYSEVARILSPRPVVIRTMDLGGDKIPRFSRGADDIAFRTGKRGLSYSLAEKTMFRTQIGAILDAAKEGDLRIMFPMVTGVADLKEALDLVDEVIKTGGYAKRPTIGAMIETPAAVFDIDGILEMVDFVSIGTNDLTHFILATDRESQDSAGALAFLHPSVLKATEHVVRSALHHEVPVYACGEAAGDPSGACLLLGMGVRDLSMTPFQAPRMRSAIGQLSMEQMETAVGDAIAAKTPKGVQDILAHTFAAKVSENSYAVK
ncbi:MAG: phosphoenolpyruvate--protein phosphotransferase [Candidatus Brocadiia bacterium]